MNFAYGMEHHGCQQLYLQTLLLNQNFWQLQDKLRMLCLEAIESGFCMYGLMAY